MGRCVSCGGEYPDGSRFCNGCGAALAAPAIERRKLVTSVFCDLSGSTAMGELADAESVFELMRTYFDTARAALERHGGAVEKFIGDAVVGMFGVPEAHEDDALRACRAALEIQERIAALDVRLETRFGTGIAVRIGVNTGEVVAGDAAQREMFASGDAVVLGDAVNVAARLEQAAAPGEILVGDDTYRLVRDAVTVEAVEPIAAKGKAKPLVAFRLLGASAQGSLPRPAGTPLVGRTAELQMLEAEFEQVAEDRRCRLITVAGEAGAGKSRLALELIGRIGSRARVARGGCLSYGDGITYWPVAQIVRALAGIRDDHSVDQARSRVPPRVAQLLGLDEGSMTPEQAVDAVARFLEGAAAGEPLVAVVDDIHWAEPSLLDLLERLPRLVDAPVLVLCLARPELREQRPDWPVTAGLEPLGSSEVDALLESLDAPAAARVRIAQTAAGNPLYTEELVAWAHEGGDLDALPTSLNALLSARLDRLDAGARDALERGAVEGELFHASTVVELTGEPARDAVPAKLAGLTRKDLIRLTAGTLVVGEVAYRFKHILVREVAYRGTTKSLRATLHARYADWLEQRVGARVGEYHEILGYHLEQAHRYRTELAHTDPALAARGGHHLGVAGRRAADRGDLHAAANLLDRATVLLPVDSLERLELMDPYSYALYQSGRMLESLANADELCERATALGELGFAASARLRRAGHDVFLPGSDLDEAWAIGERAVVTFTELGDDAGLARAKRLLGSVCYVTGRSADAVMWHERALVHANVCGDLVTRRQVTESLANNVVSGPMPAGDAIRRCEELLDENRDDRILEVLITRSLSVLLAMAGRFDEAREARRRSNRILDEARMATPTGSRRTAAEAKELAGDRDGAVRELEEMWSFFRGTLGGAPHQLALAAAFKLANVYCDAGRWDDAEACLDFYRDTSDRTTLRTAADRLAAAARVAAHRGELDEAFSLARRGVELTEPTDMLNTRACNLLALAEVHRVSGDDVEADAAIVKALDLYEQKGNFAAAGGVRAAANA